MMIDIDPISSCRICLEYGAIYPIFKDNEELDSCYSKLAVCIREKLINIEGYPTNICIKCKNTSDTICHFVSKFEETCKILDSKLVKVKTEYIEPLDDDNDAEPFYFELNIDNLPLTETKVEQKDPTELLESLKHLTVKRVKLKNDSVGTANSSSEVKEDKRRRCRPTKATALSASKNAGGKLIAEKKTVVKPAAANNNAVSKTTMSSSKAAKDINGEKIQRKKEVTKLTTLTITPALCDSCGVKFEDKNMLKKHIFRFHTERKFKCTECNKSYLSSWHLKEHQKRHENVRSHICETCGKGFYNKKGLNSHNRFVHQNVKPKFSGKCRFCDKTYTHRRGVIIHERSVHTGERPEVCSICNGRFYDKAYLREHMRIHTGHTPFKCPVCERGFTQLGNMKSHMHHNHKISDLTPDIIAKIKPNHMKFMKPLAKIKELIKRKEEIIKLREKSKTANAKVSQRLCDLCGATFKSADRLSYHKRNTHGEKKYKCAKCSRAFLREAELTNHTLKHHEKVTTVECDHCGKGFFSKCDLKRHIDIVHKKVRRYTIYKCSYCEKSFKYKRGRIVHERAVHTGERPSVCEVCGSSFYDEVYLKEHMRLHTGDTPHKCPVCARGYAQRGNMKSHMRNHRISELTSDILAKIKPNYFKFMRP